MKRRVKMWLGLVLGAVLAFVWIWFRFNAGRQWYADQPYRIIIWDRGQQSGDQVISVSYFPQTESVEAIVIPSTYRFEAALGYGSFSLDKLDELDEQEKLGGELIRKTIGRNLGMYYRGVVTAKAGEGTGLDKKRLFKLWPRYIITRSDWISRMEAMLVFWRLTDLSKDKYELVNLEEHRAGSESGLQPELDPERFSREVVVRRGQVAAPPNIAVINLTGSQGLARKMATILEREGYQVITVDSDDSGIDQDRLSRMEFKADEEFKNYWFKRLKPITLIDRTEILPEASREEIRITLGTDFAGF